ncbi:CAP domain-containing protein [Pseudoduganella sp.]|uniref:CAP domain-containing protein n=1 Tax=Pseudoduganella sp. TaxID=1880898 RepID=UPI0035B30B34
MNRLVPLAAILAALLPGPAAASDGAQLVALVNAWRAAPASCQGRMRPALPQLAPRAVLSRVALRPGSILLAELDRAGYDPELADAVQVAGPADARQAFDILREHYCATLSNPRYRDIGAHRDGNEWTVVLAAAMPDPQLVLPGQEQAGQEVLAATNAARAVPRDCGGVAMPAAPPVRWSARLAAAALQHSQDMAQQGYFSHTDTQGNDVAQRALAAGYAWRSVAENIARGQNSAQEAVAGWLNSPGHCRSLMDARMSEMGAAYSIRSNKRSTAYWTQVFASPR